MPSRERFRNGREKGYNKHNAPKVVWVAMSDRGTLLSPGLFSSLKDLVGGESRDCGVGLSHHTGAGNSISPGPRHKAGRVKD
jgi:hypothetical protein